MLSNKILLSLILVSLPLPSLAHDDALPPVAMVEQDILVWKNTQPWLSDAEFVYGEDAAAFDVADYLHKNTPELLPYKESLMHWSGYFSISPKLVLLLLAMQSEHSDQSATKLSAQPFGELSQKTGFDAQLKDVLSRLHLAYYQFRSFDRTQTVTSHYPQVFAARIKSDKGGMLFSPISLSLR